MKKLRKKQSKRKYRKKQSKGIQDLVEKFILKTVAFLLIISLNWTGISAVLETFAYFSDNESSNTNIYETGTLDFSLRSGQGNFVPIITAGNMNPGDSVARDIYINKLPNSLLFKHSVSYNFIDGNEDFCDQLQLKIWYNHYFGPVSGGYANRDMRLKYNGPLTSLTNLTDADFIIPHPDDQFDTDSSDGTEQWFYYSIVLPSATPDSFQEKTCQFKFVFDGWQTNFPDSSLAFSDQEEITNFLQSGKWIISEDDVVINELMWMGSYRKNKDEWIELRNMTDSPIDIGGWQLTKLKGKKKEKLMLKIPNGYIIPANGFFLISNDKNDKKDKSAINVEPDLVDKKVDLKNKKLQIKLYKGDWKNPSNLIDTADDGKGKPLAGLHGKVFHFSMERNDIPGDGTLEANWHTCWDDSQEMRNYWDPMIVLDESINRGTPSGRNLSDYNEAELIEYYQQLEEEWIAEGLFVPDPILEEENYDEEEMPETPVGEELPVEEETLLEEEEPLIEEEPVNEETSTIPEELIIEEEPVVEEEIIEELVEEPVVEEIPATEEEPTVEEASIIEEETVEEEVLISGDEIITEETTETSGETTEDVIEDVTEEVVEVPIADETPIDEAPEAEEQPAVLSDDDFSTQDTIGESEGDGGSGDGGDDASSLDSSSPTESVVDSSVD